MPLLSGEILKYDKFISHHFHKNCLEFCANGGDIDSDPSMRFVHQPTLYHNIERLNHCLKPR